LKQHLRLWVPLAFLALGGCENPDRAWEIAERDDTPRAYLEYLAKYPDSEFAEPARERIEALGEIRAWERTQFRDTEAGYAAFIEKFPDSAFVADAQNQILNIQRDEAWAVAQDADSAEVIAAFLKEFPDAPQTSEALELMSAIEAAEVPRKPAVPVERAGDYRLQLASFRTAKAADTELRRLVALFPDALLGPITIRTPHDGDANPMFVLKSVPMSNEEAQAVCRQLKKLKQVCLIVER
jgi:hypothetical protein